MLEIRKPDIVPGNIIYINRTPYYVFRGLTRIGHPGEAIKSATLWRDIDAPDTPIAGFKISGDNVCYYFYGNPDKMHTLTDNVIGGVLTFDASVALISPDGTVKEYSQQFTSLDDTYKTAGINRVKGFYSPFGIEHGLLQDDKDRIFIWRGEKDINECYQLPGSKLYHLSYHRERGFPSFDFFFVLTDKGLFGYKYAEDNEVPDYFSPDTMDSSKYFNVYKLPLPEGIEPNNIRTIANLDVSNMYLLTNDGKVYSIGKNTYYQRGTTKKLKVDKWNEINYPEKIIDIGAIYNKPGLFALSENGNLYYHGYNESSYYPITNRKSNIGKPLKIATGIQALWVPHSDIFSYMDNSPYMQIPPVFVVNDKNELVLIPTNGTLQNKNKKEFIIVPSNKVYTPGIYKRLNRDLVFTPDMLRSLISFSC